MGQSGLDASIDGPAIEGDDAFLEFGVAPRFGGQRFELGDAIEDVLCTRTNVFPNSLLRIEGEILREITDDQVASLRDRARVGYLQAGEHPQERRFPATVASDQTGTIVFLDGERGAIEDDLLVVAHDDLRGGDYGRHFRINGTGVVQQTRFGPARNQAI